MAWVSIYENGVINSDYFGNTFTETIISGGWTSLSTYFGNSSIVFSGSSSGTWYARQAQYNFTDIHNCTNATKIRFSGTLTATLGYSGNTYLWFGSITPGTTTTVVKEDVTSQTKTFEKEFDISNLSELTLIYQCANNASSEIHLEKIEIDIPLPTYTSNGGGATHIAKVTGQLKDLSSNLSDILMVSGGGGGGLLSGETEYTGKEAGGISGSGDNSADQSTGNAFGQGESGTNVSGGGSGLYGGYKGTSSKSGGAGSGYIGNSLLSNKKMVGYNVPTSSAESTKTESVNEASANPVSGKPKIGNGFVKIKFLRDTNIPPEYSYISDINECYYSAQDGTVYDLYDKTIEYHRTTVSGTFHIINTDASFSSDDFLGNRGEISSNKVATFSAWENITISVDSSNPSSVVVSYSPSNPTKEIIVDFETSAQVYYDLWVYENVQNVIGNGAGAISHFNTSFNSLKSAIDYIYQHYCNITLIVDGVLWVAHRSE